MKNLIDALSSSQTLRSETPNSAMSRRVALFAISAIFIVVYVVAYDRWRQKQVIGLILSCFETSTEVKTKKVLKDVEKDFAEDFLIGVSTSAYQVEGGWNESGKTPSIWDNFVHFHPHAVDDNSTADVGTDSWHHWKDDIRALKLVGVSRMLAICDKLL